MKKILSFLAIAIVAIIALTSCTATVSQTPSEQPQVSTQAVTSAQASTSQSAETDTPTDIAASKVFPSQAEESAPTSESNAGGFDEKPTVAKDNSISSDFINPCKYLTENDVKGISPQIKKVEDSPGKPCVYLSDNGVSGVWFAISGDFDQPSYSSYNFTDVGKDASASVMAAQDKGCDVYDVDGLSNGAWAIRSDPDKGVECINVVLWKENMDYAVRDGYGAFTFVLRWANVDTDGVVRFAKNIHNSWDAGRLFDSEK